MHNTSTTDDQAQAFLRFYNQAQQGDAEAQFQTGVCYAHGRGVAQSYREAAVYWLNAAKQSHSLAQMHLGVLFEKGLGFPQDYQKALQCYQAASDEGLAEAKVRLAMMYLKGLGVSQDVKKAISLFIQAAEQGDATAQYNLGAAYDKGLGGLTTNSDLARFWYQQAANQQQPQAIKALQAAAAVNDTQEDNKTTAAIEPSVIDASIKNTSIDKATDSLAENEQFIPSPASQANFSDDDIPVNADSDMLFTQAVAVLKTDMKAAFKEFEQAAKLGHAKAQYNIGLAHLYGLAGYDLSIDIAIEWLEKSAEQSYRPAYVVLGWLYQGGKPTIDTVTSDVDDAIIIDNDTAISYYEMASELGYPQAQYYLSQIYATGNGIVPDTQKALTWLKQSAKHGYSAAYYQLDQLKHKEPRQP